MNLAAVLLDAGPVAAGIGLFAGIAFFLVLAAVAFAAFLMLRKTLKMAFRIAIVVVILLIAVAGGIAFFAIGIASSSGGHRPPAPNARPRASQPK
ncbi:MAG: hypothetical protein ABJA02_12090 [Acidobacteriota bacterium]